MISASLCTGCTYPNWRENAGQGKRVSSRDYFIKEIEPVR
jgi:hypothetical protein